MFNFQNKIHDMVYDKKLWTITVEIGPEIREMVELAEKEIKLVIITMSRIQRKHEHNKRNGNQKKRKEKQMNLLDIKISTSKWEIHLMDLRTDSFMKKTSVNLKMGQ